MDFDILISVIVWVVVIIASVISSKNKKSKAKREHQPRPVIKPSVAAADTERWEAFDSMQQSMVQPRPAQPAAPKPSKPKAAPLPEEGIRATVRTTAPMAPNPKEKPWLADRKNLVNSLIYGEVLRPKF